MRIVGILIRSVIQCAVFVSLLTAVASWAEDGGVPQLVDPAVALAAAARATHTGYPDANTVIVEDQSRIIVEASGAHDDLSESYEKILTDEGRRALATRQFSFDRFYEGVEVLRLSVIKADGRRMELDPKAQCKEAVSRAMMGANIYDPNERVLTVSIPDRDVGDTIHMVVRQRTRIPQMTDSYGDIIGFESTSPILHMGVEISTPEVNPLRCTAILGEIPGTVTHRVRTEGGRVIHTWEGRSIPQCFSEPGMPSLNTCGQRVLVSTSADWQSISKWYWGLSAPHLKATSAITAKARKLAKGGKTRIDKIKCIFRFVSQEIRYMGITTETTAPGFEPHDVKITFDNRYGVCRDKAALLVAMLRAADIKAYPVLIMVGPKRDVEVPIPYFNHAIVGAEDGEGGYMLMDPTNENTAELMPGYLYNLSYLVARPEGETLRNSPVAPADRNMAQAETTAEITAGGALSCSTVLIFSGINDSAIRARLASLRSEDVRLHFESVVKDVAPGATLSKLVITPENPLDTTQPVSVRLSFTAPDFLSGNSRTALVRIPWVAVRFGLVHRQLENVTGLDKRRFPLRLSYTCGIRETITLTLPDTAGATLAMPDIPTLDTPGLFFCKNYRRSGRTLTASVDLQLRKPEFTPAEYLTLKGALRDLEYASRQMPILALRSGADEGGDIHVLRRSTETLISDAHNWTATNRVAKKVLTYAGKKHNAELHLDYIPGWTDVSVDYARVTQADGTVKEVQLQEKNIMDSDWVSNAPRYPAGKTLVVSLPGVDVGSLIEYQVTTRARNQPFFSINKTFADFDPVDDDRLRIIYPSGMKLAVDDHAEATVTHSAAGDAEIAAFGARLIPHENNLPPLRGVAGMLSVSSCTNDADYARLVGEAVRSLAQPTAAVTAKANELTASCADAQARIMVIRNFIDHAIRQAGPAFNRVPLSALSRAEITLRDGYGNEADRMILLHAMLAAAGLEPEFLLVAGNPARTVERGDGPLLDGFYDRLVVRVKLDGKEVCISDFSEYAKLGTTGLDACAAITLDGRQPFTLYASGELADRKSLDYRVVVDATGETLITFTENFPGSAYAAFRRRFADMQPEERRRFHQERLNDLSPNARAEGPLTISEAYPGTLTFTARIPRYVVRSGHFLYFDLPRGISQMLIPATSTERQLPFFMDTLNNTFIHWSVSLPARMSIKSAPEDVDWSGPGDTGKVVLKTVQKKQADGSCVVDRTETIHFTPGIVPPASYASILELNRRLTQANAWRVLLEDGAR